MSNLKNSIVQVLGYLSNVKGINTYPSQISGTVQDANTESFELVLAKLDNSIHNASLNNSMSTYNYNNYIFDNRKSNSMQITPNINSIVSKIKDSQDEVLDIDSEITEYLIENYGGSKIDVIKNLSGVQNLPYQASLMQDQIFQNIITKLSVKVRENYYSSQESDNFSLYYSDDTSVDTSYSE